MRIPRNFDGIRIGFCKFRTKFYALSYGFPDEYGISWEMLGVKIVFYSKYKRAF